MASRDEMISKAVNSVIEENEVVDLLLISDFLDDINDEDIGKVRDYGMHYAYLYIGMSGQKMVDKMNENWEATDAEFLAHNKAIQLRIISEDIKQLREENGVIQYTKDGENWISLISTWGSITGDITKQVDLQQALLQKASTSDLNNLTNRVSLCENNIIQIQASEADLQTQLNYIITQLSGPNGILLKLDEIDENLRTKISSENVKQIREINGSLEYTTDGSTWTPVSTAGIVEWGDITGSIGNQPDLQLLLNNISDNAQRALNISQQALDDVTNLNNDLDNRISNTTNTIISPISNNLSNHTTNMNNPHQVTKEQLGIYIVSKDQYNSLTINNNYFYIVDDNYYNPYKYLLTFDFNGGTYDSKPNYDYYHGEDTMVTFSNIITSTPTYSSHTFLGFSNSATTSIPDYTLSDTYNTLNQNEILYAIWN